MRRAKRSYLLSMSFVVLAIAWLGVLFSFFGAAAAYGFPVSITTSPLVAGLSVALVLGYGSPRAWAYSVPAFVVGSVAVYLVARASLLALNWQVFLPPRLLISSVPSKLFVGFTFSGAVLVLCGAQLRRSRKSVLSELGVGCICLLLLAPLLFSAYHLRGYGLIPIAQGGRVTSFLRLCDNLDRFYAHWPTAPVRSATLRARYLSRVQEAARECSFWGACPAYRTAIADMLAELEDGHTGVVWPPVTLLRPEITISEVDGEAVVVDTWGSARSQGVVPGVLVLSVDGRALSEAIEQVPSFLKARSTPRTRTRASYEHVLWGVTERITISGEMPNGQDATFTLPRVPLATAVPSPVRTKHLLGRFGYVVVRSLRNGATIKDFDQALSRYPNAEGLILDLRKNRGGDSRIGNALAGRFISEPLRFGEECYRGGHPLVAGGASGCYPAIVQPRPPLHAGKLAVLLDGDVSSSAEWMAAILCDSGRARCFGRPTAGDSGNPVIHFLPGLTVRYSAGSFRRGGGQALEGVGLEPHVLVAQTLDDIRSGRDADLEAALGWLVSE